MSRLVSLDEVEQCVLPGEDDIPPQATHSDYSTQSPSIEQSVQRMASRLTQVARIEQNVQPPRLELLRELPGILKHSPEENIWEHPTIPHGIPRGAITEVARPSGTGRTAFVLELLAAHPTQRAAWIEDELSFYPPALPLYGVDMNQLLFVEAGPDLLWATQQILRSQLFPIVVLEKGRALLGENDLRRLQILAHQGNTALLLLCEKPAQQGSWIFKRRA